MRASVWMEDLWIISFYEGRNIHQTKNHFQVIIKPFINKCKLKEAVCNYLHTNTLRKPVLCALALMMPT